MSGRKKTSENKNGKTTQKCRSTSLRIYEHLEVFLLFQDP